MVVRRARALRRAPSVSVMALALTSMLVAALSGIGTARAETALEAVAAARDQLSAASARQAATLDLVETAEEQVEVAEEALVSAQSVLAGARVAERDAHRKARAAGRVAERAERASKRATARSDAANAVVWRLARSAYIDSYANSELAMLVEFATDGNKSLGDLAQQLLAADRVQDRLFEESEAASARATDSRAVADSHAATYRERVTVRRAARADLRAAKRTLKEARTDLRNGRSAFANAERRRDRAEAAVDRQRDKYREAFLAACRVDPTNPPAPPAQAANSAALVWNTLRINGFSEHAAAGVLGNLQQESGIDPTSVQSGGPGRGIAQWSAGGRWDNGPASLMAYASARGLDPWDARTQTEFIIWEMRQDTFGFDLERFKDLKDIEEATVYFHDVYERSADSDSYVRTVRVGYANAWFGALAGTEPDEEGRLVNPTISCPV